MTAASRFPVSRAMVEGGMQWGLLICRGHVGADGAESGLAPNILTISAEDFISRRSPPVSFGESP